MRVLPPLHAYMGVDGWSLSLAIKGDNLTCVTMHVVNHDGYKAMNSG